MHRSCIPRAACWPHTVWYQSPGGTLVILKQVLDYALTGGNCEEKRRKSLHRLFVCTKCSRFFFLLWKILALSFLCTLRSSCYYRKKRGGNSVDNRYCGNKLNDLNKGNNWDFRSVDKAMVAPIRDVKYGFHCTQLLFHWNNPGKNMNGSLW